MQNSSSRYVVRTLTAVLCVFVVASAQLASAKPGQGGGNGGGRPTPVTYWDDGCRTTVVTWADDPCAGRQWGLEKIKAPSAWSVTRGAGVTVAVVDTGA